jgi:hypothetical protein
MPTSKHLTHGISNLVSLITKTKLGLSPMELLGDVDLVESRFGLFGDSVIVGAR